MTAPEPKFDLSDRDTEIKSVTDQLGNLGAVQNRVESVVRGADYPVEDSPSTDSKS